MESQVSMEVTENNAPLGFFQRFGKMFIAPSMVFDSLRRKPDFIWPVIFILLSIAFSYPTSNFSTRLLAETFPKYAEVLGTANKNIASVSAVAIGLATALVMLLIAWVIRSGVFTLFAKLLGGEAPRFSSVLAAVGYTYLPLALRSIFTGVAFMTTETVPPLGLDMGMELTDRFFTPLGNLLGEINPFTVLYIVFTMIALERIFKLSRGKALFVTVCCWAVVVGVNILTSVFTLQQFR